MDRLAYGQSFAARILRVSLLTAIFVFYPLARAASQSSQDLISGRVTTATDQSPIVGAIVGALRAPDRAAFSAVTDSLGKYTITVPDGTGDYLLTVSRTGWTSIKRRVRRPSNGDFGTIDFQLEREPTNLGVVSVHASRPVPQVGEVESVGSPADETDTGVRSNYSAARQGDFLAAALGIIDLSLQDAGAGANRLSVNDNSTVLNGVNFSGPGMPREAQATVRVGSSIYDPSRGGFSGRQTSVEMSSGGEYVNRLSHVTLASTLSPSLAREHDAQGRYVYVDAGLGQRGTFKKTKTTYNISGETWIDKSAVPSLFSLTNESLRTLGLSRDSVNRFLALLSSKRVLANRPVSPAAQTFEAQLAGYLEHSSDESLWTLTSYFRTGYASGIGNSPIAIPSHSSQSLLFLGSIVSGYSRHIGSEKGILSETRLGLNLGSARTSPTVVYPDARVAVSSGDPNGETALTDLVLGGSPFSEAEKTWSLEGQSSLAWYAPGGQHRLSSGGQFLIDGFNKKASTNSMGSFAFASLEDFAIDRPSAFVRNFGLSDNSANQFAAIGFFADYWRPSDKLQLLYGLRVEASTIAGGPPINRDAESTFGIPTGVSPATFGVSPRFGFTWTYGSIDRRRVSTSNSIGNFRSPSPSAVRGGVGLFRNRFPVASVASALDNTGLPGNQIRLECYGDATPIPTWNSLVGPSTFPSNCQDAPLGQVRSASAPRLVTFSPDYQPAESWRGNLGWNSVFFGWAVNVNGSLSLNSHLASFFEYNVRSDPVFELKNESNRPVFVPTSAIDSLNGLISPVEARKSINYSSVAQIRSDLRSISRTVSISLGSVPHPDSRHFLQLGYALGIGRQQKRGYDGATFDQPNRTHWERADWDVRHRAQAQAGILFDNSVGISSTFNIRSGLPYTPITATDVNGDGDANDRAFVFDPLLKSNPNSSALSRALSSFPRKARECLLAQVGRPAEVNSCDGPWSTSLDIRVEYGKPVPGSHKRVHIGANISNVLALLGDRLGAPAGRPDNRLYSVKNFNTSSNTFEYRVNSRFGTQAPSIGVANSGMRVGFDVSIDLGAPINVQMLEKSLGPRSKTSFEQRSTAPQIAARYARSIKDVYKEIIDNSDSLLITRDQLEQLSKARQSYRRGADSIWLQLGEYMATLPINYSAPEVLKRIEAERDKVWALTFDQGDTVNRILSPLQVSMLPRIIGLILFRHQKWQSGG